jgi:Pyridoxamine 5'-phosphate oxidase
MYLDDVARAIIDGNRYMVLGTADEGGRPWVSPVHYAPSGFRAPLGLLAGGAALAQPRGPSGPEHRGLRLAGTGRRGSGRVHVGRRRAADGRRPRPGIEIFSRVSVSHGAKEWTVDDVQPPAALRLYRARVAEHWVLDPERRPDQRTRVRP